MIAFVPDTFSLLPGTAFDAATLPWCLSIGSRHPRRTRIKTRLSCWYTASAPGPRGSLGLFRRMLGALISDRRSKQHQLLSGDGNTSLTETASRCFQRTQSEGL